MAERSKRAPKSTVNLGGKDAFSRREREIMDALYKLGKASAAQILEQIPNPPTYTAVRTLLTILEKKGHVRHQSDGTRYVRATSAGGLETVDAVGERAFGPRRLDSPPKTASDDPRSRTRTRAAETPTRAFAERRA